jgi:ribonuclease-3
VAERAGEASNERLEFLGDAVLGLAVADLVYKRYPDVAEGQLTDARKAVVNANALAELARELDIGPHILLGKGEAAAGGADKPSILSDALEAIIGAFELDGGPEIARDIVQSWIAPRLDAAMRGVGGLDHKTLLQELAARLGMAPPQYRITEEGPDHAKRFSAVVVLDGEARGRGEGRSKKQAEQAAAEVAYRAMIAEAGVEGDQVAADA